MHLVLRQAQVAGADVLHGVELDLFEADDLGRDMDLAVAAVEAVEVFLVEDVEDLDLGVVDGVGVIIDVGLLDVGFALVVIQLLDEILLALADVDRLGVERRQGRGEVDLGDDLGFVRSCRRRRNCPS